MSTHGLERTSLKGEKFFGTCRYCGTPNLPMEAALAPCEKAPSRDQQILDAVAGHAPASETPKTPIFLRDTVDDFAVSYWIERGEALTLAIQIFVRRAVQMQLALDRTPRPASETGQASAWQPSSTPPERAECVLVTWGTPQDDAVIAWFKDGNWRSEEVQTLTPPTHWMLLPLAPSEDETTRKAR